MIKEAYLIHASSSTLNGEKTLQLAYPEAGLELAAVSSEHLSVLIIAGTAKKKVHHVTKCNTIRVHSIEYVRSSRETGAEQLQPVQKTPVGGHYC
jgi:hypothetical protein